MITIKKILGNEKFDVMVNKLNENFTQLAQLNGGPRGKHGKQGIPGLPGLQGRQGFKGDDGLDGNRVFLVNPDPSGYGLSSLPDESTLGSLILDGTYNVGDVFVWYNSDGQGSNNISKIVEQSAGVYTYATYTIQAGAVSDYLWIRHNAILLNGKYANRTFLIRTDNYHNVGNDDWGYLHNAYVDYRNTWDPISAAQSLSSGSASTPLIGIFNKSHFKFGLTQTTPPTGATGKDFYESGTDGRIGNMWNVYPKLADNYFTYDIFSDGVFNDPPTGDGGDSGKLSVYDMIRTGSPVLYLQGVRTTYNGQPADDSGFKDFGFVVQKIQSQSFKGLNKKTILSIVSDTAGENDVYFRQNRVWGDSSFISEINKYSQTKGERFYSAIITPHGETDQTTKAFRNIITTQQKVNYGISTYYDDGDGTEMKFLTGFQTKNDNFGLSSNVGSINAYVSGHTFSSNSLQPASEVYRYQVLRIGKTGSIVFQSDFDTGVSPFEDIDPVSTFMSKYTFRGPQTGTRWSILKVDDVNDKGFAISRNKGDASSYGNLHYHNADIGASLYLNERGKKASFSIVGKKSDTDNDIMLYELRASDEFVEGGYNGRFIQYSNASINSDTYYPGYTWGLGKEDTPYTVSYPMGLDKHNQSSEANAFLWLVKNWTSDRTLANYTSNRLLDASCINPEVSIFLMRGRLQMNIADNPTDVTGTATGQVNLTDSIMTSRDAYGVAQWQRKQTVIGDYDYIDMLEIRESGPGISFTTLSCNKFIHIFESPNSFEPTDDSDYLLTNTYVAVLPSIDSTETTGTSDYLNDEHTIVVKAQYPILTEVSKDDLDSFEFIIAYQDTNTGDTISLASLNRMEKDMFLKGSVITIKVKCIIQHKWTKVGTTFVRGDDYKTWTVIEKSNAFTSSDFVNDTVWGKGSYDLAFEAMSPVTGNPEIPDGPLPPPPLAPPIEIPSRTI